MGIGPGRGKIRTGLTKGLVVKARLAHVESVPYLRIEFLIDVDNIQVLVLDIRGEHEASGTDRIRQAAVCVAALTIHS
jgi:hypothetical protein